MRLEYLAPVKASCAVEREAAGCLPSCSPSSRRSTRRGIAGITDQAEIKEEKYVYKNKQFDAKVTYQQGCSLADREHGAFAYRYHLIDLLRIGKFTFAENYGLQRWENYKYTFNTRTVFAQQRLLYIAICAGFHRLVRYYAGC